MDVEIPRTLDDALAFLALRDDAEPIAGGTDLMVEMNFGRHRPKAVVAIDRIEELRQILVSKGGVRLSGGVTYSRMLKEDIRSPAMQQAARTVGSPQIRNAGTIGGNLGTCSPAGDTLPVLAALDAKVVLRSASTHRRVPFTEYMTGPKK
ncbi:MAG TPA: FAD binding domain-containing protein, partial [Candidatus Limnocylindria bacterium]